jgi:hypothetical protein
MIVRPCAWPGCETLVVGGFCLEHEVRPKRVFVRGRPFSAPGAATGAATAAEPVAPLAPLGPPIGLEPGLSKTGGRLPAAR